MAPLLLRLMPTHVHGFLRTRLLGTLEAKEREDASCWSILPKLDLKQVEAKRCHNYLNKLTKLNLTF